MANPFGLPRVILAEREARRRRRFQLGVYAVLTATTVLLAGMLIQGCRSQRQSHVEPIAGSRVRTANHDTTNLTTNTPSDPDSEQPMETNYVSPGSASLPENVTLPAPVVTSIPNAITTHTRVFVKVLHKGPPAHNTTNIYLVKSGDTLVRIAKAHGTTVNALETANHMNTDHIYAGEKLKMPQAFVAAAKVAQD